MITIELKDADVTSALARAAAMLTDLTPLMSGVANLLLDQTEQRFKDQKAPDGTPWAPRSPTTLNAYERRAKTADGVKSWGGVLRYSGQLNDNLFSSHGPDFAMVSSPEPYAAAMQFGARKGSLGAYWWTTESGKVVEGSSPWGDIPARPFFGISDDNRTDILNLISDYIEGILHP